MKNKNNIAIEGARIIFRNFSGKAVGINPEGRRNFCVLLDPELAAKLIEEGWNVRWLRPKDDQETEQAFLQVTVRYDNYPPKIIMMSSRGQSILDEEAVSILDWAEIETIDLIISPSDWSVNGKTGIKAYVKSMYVLIAEDEFEKKWANAPDSAVDSIGGCGNCEACDGSCGCNGH